MAKTTFEMPRGDAEFDDLEEGEKMTVSCTIRKEGADQACLVAVDGQTLPGYSDEEEDEATEEEDGSGEASEGDMMTVLDEEM